MGKCVAGAVARVEPWAVGWAARAAEEAGGGGRGAR